METLLQGLRVKMEKETGYKAYKKLILMHGFIKPEMCSIDTKIVIPVRYLPL